MRKVLSKTAQRAKHALQEIGVERRCGTCAMWEQFYDKPSEGFCTEKPPRVYRSWPSFFGYVCKWGIDKMWCLNCVHWTSGRFPTCYCLRIRFRQHYTGICDYWRYWKEEQQ